MKGGITVHLTVSGGMATILDKNSQLIIMSDIDSHCYDPMRHYGHWQS